MPKLMTALINIGMLVVIVHVGLDIINVLHYMVKKADALYENYNETTEYLS